MRPNLPGLDLSERLPSPEFYHAYKDGQPYTVKVTRESGDKEASFRVEALLAARLSHPVAPRVFHVGSAEGWAYLVRDQVRGRPLAAALPLPAPRLLKLARELAGALAQIHALGKVHRGLNPQSVWVDQFGRAQFLDLGSLTESGLPADEAVTEFAYASPEQLGLMGGTVDARSDLYSLGAVLYACATGRPPLEARDLSEHLSQLAVKQPVPIDLAPVMRLLAKDPQDRYPSAEALLHDLEGEPPPPLHGSPADAPQRQLEVAAARGHLRLSWGEWTLEQKGLHDTAPIPKTAPAAPASPQHVRERNLLETLMELGLTAATVLKPEQHARHTLDHTMKLLGAERAFLYLLQPDLQFWVGRSAAGEDLLEPHDVSTTVLEQVRAGQTVFAGTGEIGIRTKSVLAHDLRSVIAAPLSAHNKPIGVIYLDNKLARGLFTDEHKDVLLALGNHIAQALETARAARLEADVEAERRERRFAQVLQDAIASMAATLEESEVLVRLAKSVAQAIECDSSTAYARRDEGWVGLDSGLTPPPEALSVTEPTAGRGFLAVPIGEVGLVVLKREGEFRPTELEMARAFASHARVAVDNARLFQRVQRMATVDELTGVWNRRQFLDLARREGSRSARSGAPLTAFMLDIDFFKKFNDSYGHAVGDAVLKEVAARCQGALRDTDIFGRLGGEEFAAILPDTASVEAALQVAERLRESVASTPLDAGEHGMLKLTVSVGVARGSSDVEALLSQADAALYEAKGGGRNCVRVYNNVTSTTVY